MRRDNCSHETPRPRRTHHQSSGKLRFPLLDLILIPAVLGVLFVKDGAEALRIGVPYVFVMWVAIRQRASKTITIINPYTVGIVAGAICYPLHQLATSELVSELSLASVVKSVGFGALAGFGISIMAVLQFVVALFFVDYALKRSN